MLMHGKQAAIYWDHVTGTDTNLQHGQSWSLEATHDVVEVTSMQDVWAVFLGGLADWTATVECLLDSVNGSEIPFTAGGVVDGLGDAGGRLELYCIYDSEAGVYKCIYGTGICTGISPGANKDGAATIRYAFQGIGQLQWYSGATRPS